MNKYQIRATNVSRDSAYAIAAYILSAKAGTLFNMDIEDAGTYTISFLLEAENELPAEVANGVMTGVVQHISAVTMKEDRQETDEIAEKEPEDESQPEVEEAPAEVTDVDFQPKAGELPIDAVVTAEDQQPEDENPDDGTIPTDQPKDTEDSNEDAEPKAVEPSTDEAVMADPFVQLNYDLEKAETVEDIILATAVYIGYDEDTTEKLRMVTYRFVSLMNAGVEVTWKNVWKKIKGIDPIDFDSKKKYLFQPLLTKPLHKLKKGVQFPAFIKSCIQKSLYWKNVQESKNGSGVAQKDADSAEGGSESK